MHTVPSDPWYILLDSLAGDRDTCWEVIDGFPAEKPRKGAQADQLILSLLMKIHARTSSCGLGLCFSGRCGYGGIFPHDAKRLRYSSISFIRSGRLPDGKPPRGHLRIVPDLIVEVLSYLDDAEEIDDRIADFLKAGVPLAWMIDPMAKYDVVFRQGSATLRLGESNTLDGEDIRPGFSCVVSDRFDGI
jgi:hypothetical protein